MKALFTIILIIFFNNSYSQTATNTSSHNDKNIYYQALTQYVNFQKWERGVTLDTVYVQDDYVVTDSLLQESGQTKFIKVRPDQIQGYLKSQKSIILYKVFPLRFEDGEFYVTFVPFLISHEKKVFLPGDKKKQGANNNGVVSYRIVYKFDNDRFLFQRVEDHNI